MIHQVGQKERFGRVLPDLLSIGLIVLGKARYGEQGEDKSSKAAHRIDCKGNASRTARLRRVRPEGSSPKTATPRHRDNANKIVDRTLTVSNESHIYSERSVSAESRFKESINEEDHARSGSHDDAVSFLRPEQQHDKTGR